MTLIRYLVRALLCLPLMPIIWWEGFRLEQRIPKLPEARGTRGESGVGTPPIRVMIIGESTMAGVGVEEHKDGFAGFLGRALSTHFQARVQWQVYARSGYTVARLNREILPQIADDRVDVVVIGIGANDAFKLSTPWHWRQSLQTMIHTLRGRFEAPIAFIHMPPINDFPVFTPMLKFSVGYLGRLLGNILENLVATESNVWCISEPLTTESWSKRDGLELPKAAFFSDGVHPSALTYELWAKDVVAFIVREKILL